MPPGWTQHYRVLMLASALRNDYNIKGGFEDGTVNDPNSDPARMAWTAI